LFEFPFLAPGFPLFQLNKEAKHHYFEHFSELNFISTILEKANFLSIQKGQLIGSHIFEACLNGRDHTRICFGKYQISKIVSRYD
jgi:hypothetical protein